jgi:putative transposase
MTAWLRREGYQVNPKRVRRLMRLMGLEAVYPKRWLSRPDDSHRVFPYLLRDVEVERPDHVWAADITYIRLAQGFVYLVAILDWHSRYVVSWELSNTLDTSFCVSALTRALEGGKPAIFNTDQGAQFTSDVFTSVLLDAGVQISMDGRGRVFDNIFVERLWRSVKYEEVYLHDYRTVRDAKTGLSRYFRFYNYERLHESLGYRPPHEVYVTQGAVLPTEGKSTGFSRPAAMAAGS